MAKVLIEKYNPDDPGDFGKLKTSAERRLFYEQLLNIQLIEQGLLPYVPWVSGNMHQDLVCRSPDDRFYRIAFKIGRPVLASSNKRYKLPKGERFAYFARGRGRLSKKSNGAKKRSKDVINDLTDVTCLIVYASNPNTRPQFFWVPTKDLPDATTSFFMSMKLMKEKYTKFPFNSYYKYDNAKGKERWLILQNKYSDRLTTEVDRGEKDIIID